MDVAIRTAIIALAIVIFAMLLAGAGGRLRVSDVLPLEVCAAGVLLWTTRSRPASALSALDLTALPTPAVGIAAAFLAFTLAFGARYAPLTLYDSLSYHLHFAARWVQDGAVHIVPTPFSDERRRTRPATASSCWRG